MDSLANIASALTQQARARPDAVAMYYPDGLRADGKVAYRSISYRQLDDDSSALAAGLARAGVGYGVRGVLMVKPGPEFFALMFGLFKAGAVPVLVDPGIDRSALKQCLDEAQPQAFIGIPVAHAARTILRWARSARIRITVGRRWFWGGLRYADVLEAGRRELAQSRVVATQTSPDDLAAILFTSGSTGVPKGVEYRHRHFSAQVELIRTAFDIRPGEVDVPTFPPFALFDPALGMTTVLPQMDYTRPASVDPLKLLQAIEQFGATMMFGSPALVDVLARHGATHGTRLTTLRRVISAGAPVRPEVVSRMQRLLPEDAKIWTPYGATECLPVAVVEGRDIVAVGAEATASGRGILVGRPLPQNCVRIVRIDDAPIARWSDDLQLPAGEVGEITVIGPTTTEAYFGRVQATLGAKIIEQIDTVERIVHRMGDVGYFDAEGRLWYAGRKSHRVETAAGPLYSEMVEGIFNAHPEVARSALVGLGAQGAQTPLICIELKRDVDGTREFTRIRDELLEMAAEHAMTRVIKDFLLHPAFPVDIRHNAKIGREKLALWAAESMARP